MRRRTLSLVVASAALLATAPSADAATYTVTGGKLDWTQANQLSSFGDPGRTFLGYITATVPGGGAGTVTPSAGATATGPTGAAVTVIDTTSPRGLDQLFTLSYPVTASGTYSDNGVGTFELKGTTTWVTHGIPLTLVDPQITLNGLTGTLRATGMTADMRGTPSSYDRTAVQFNLDLSKASVVLRADGARTITGIVPASTDVSALSGFGANSTRYGTMNLTIGLEYASTQVSGTGKDGAAGPAGPAGKDGRDADVRVIRLKRAPFATKSEVHVRLIDRKTNKTVAKGTVEKKTLRLSVLSGTTLKGSYTLKRTARQASGKLQATVSL